MKKYLSLIYLISLVLLLSACGTMSIDLKANGSGQVEIEIPQNDYIGTAKDLKQQLESEVDDGAGIKKIKVKETKDSTIASFEFDTLDALDSDSYEIPVSDLVILGDTILDDLELVKGTKEFTEKSSAILVKLPTNISEFSSSKITVPGKIVAHSEDASITKSNVAEFDADAGSRNYVVYEPKSGIGSIVGIVAVIAIVLGALFFIIRKKQNKK